MRGDNNATVCSVCLLRCFRGGGGGQAQKNDHHLSRSARSAAAAAVFPSRAASLLIAIRQYSVRERDGEKRGLRYCSRSVALHFK